MPRWLQASLHAVLVGSNVVLALHGVPPAIVAAISVLQAMVGCFAQEFNTDGTSQRTPYEGK